eukprot:CAMPEP_0116137730 /NCGR_PEP_ID=MMETSP0329-20121206/12397_1 /TAXON_ID=697910 /ORGANISM="Pseudo-nitzschia arenysensis, Strain B593" /LENGTH=379 /DNA_ID=CAMNT_0003632651 /DNA_START=132 /DNA_END=1271 /DNA_ORIENTATION=-
MIGLPALDYLTKMELKYSKLVGPKQVFLPKCRIHLNYYEREAVAVPESDEVDSSKHDNNNKNTPTLLLLHGIGSSSHEFLSFLRFMDIPSHIRILIPDHVAHGEDLKRAFAEGPSFQQPDAATLLETTSEFLDLVNAGPNCNALGTSLGGALLYFLKTKRPDVIQKTVLYSPALPVCLTDRFLGGLQDGTHGFMDYQNREDVKDLFRNFLWTDPQKRIANQEKKKDPFPKIAYEVIYRLTLRNVPEGHFRKLQDKLLLETAGVANDNNNEIENNNKFAVTNDIDPDSERFVVWPDEDQICSFEEGKRFFEPSVANGKTIFQEIPNCGHVFDRNGKGIYEILVPMVKTFLLDFASDNNHDDLIPTATLSTTAGAASVEAS